MEGRCAVETWAELGFSGTSCTTKVKFGFGTDVFLCSGSDEVYVFSTQERKLTAVLQFSGPVSDLVESHDKQLLYVACGSGVYCVSLQFLQSRAHSSPANASSSPTELKIPSEFLVVPEEGVLSLLLVGSLLLTVSQRDASWMLTLYNSPNQSESSSYEMLSSFSLPLVSGVVHAGMRRPALICVHSSDTTPPSSYSTSSSEAMLTNGHVRLEPVLFKLLFGIDAALAKSPVILCGLPDGCLCFLPLRPPGSRLRVLHSLEQPVVFVGASVVMETGPGHAQCLVAVGELGRVVLIKTDKGGPEGGGNIAGFIERCVPGPVMCGCVDTNCLYYSTGSDLLGLDLSERSSGREGQERVEETGAALQSPISLNVCRVIALAEPTCNTEVQLLGLSASGQLQRITLPVGREDARLSKVPSTHVGRSIRDILSAIGDVCDRASALKIAIKSKNQILRHLNQVLNISFLLIASTNSEEHLPIQEKPIRCHAMTKWSRLLQKDSLNLTCVLDNSSPYVLERGWTLSITVFPLSYSPSAGGGGSTTNFSFPFPNLHPGETLEVSLPLAAAGDATFPMTVSCSLIFSLSSLLGEEAANLPGSQSSCFSLPLNTLTVDWLHALQVNSPTATHKKATSQSNNTTADTIQAFVSSRRMRCSGRGEGGGEGASNPEREQYSASVRVSSELLRDTLVLKSSDLDPQGPKLAPQNVSLSLLEWLLSEGPGGVKTGHQGDKIALSSSVVHARGPNGHTVKLTAKEVNVGEESVGKEESLTTVEVQVESSSIAAVCGLHHAVLRRVQTLLQRAPERAACTQRVQSLGLRQALQRAEHLLQQIQQCRVSGAFGVGVSTGQMTRSLLSVYRELRENPFFII
ncbi:Fanconi anemia core complex-associated protein 100 isoform X2 [Siniperca chuatsi]|uniref:Fanconi anemia core complex-associated protein 100 isoform X2 n=1 Tax=Siniperca chuatsi TaxID=119488 RepID=UPI001CE07F87|nr:Fanconi anemia core complex-associated protein 100 isoform X2 [Siniperca chuatsi]